MMRSFLKILSLVLLWTTPLLSAPQQSPSSLQGRAPTAPSSQGMPRPHQLNQIENLPPQLENPLRPRHDDAQDILELIENQLNAIHVQDFADAYYNYTSEALREHTSLEEFAHYVQYYQVLNQNKNALFGNPEFSRHRAILRGTLTAVDGTIFKAEYFLVREGSQWRINGIKLIPVSYENAPAVPQPFHAGANYDFQGDISK